MDGKLSPLSVWFIYYCAGEGAVRREGVCFTRRNNSTSKIIDMVHDTAAVSLWQSVSHRLEKVSCCVPLKNLQLYYNKAK